MDASSRGRRFGLRFTLFGFPVRVDPTFALGAFFFAASTGADSSAVVAGVAGAIFVSILVHELGHAFAARATGAQPSIELLMIGGLTAYRPTRRLSRLEQIGISLAGPFAGFALGGVVLGVARALDVDLSAPSHNPIVYFTIWANFVWGILNLLPMLPLDGGAVMQNLLPGAAEQRARAGAVVSIVTASIAALVVMNTDYSIAIFYFALFIALNASALMRKPVGSIHHDRESPLGAALGRLEAGDGAALALVQQLAHESANPAQQSIAKVRAVDALAKAGDIDRARWVLQHFPGQAPQSSYAFVDAAAGMPHGVAMLDEIARNHPEPFSARHAILGRVLARRANEIPAYFEALPRQAQQVEALREAQYLAHVRGDFANAAMIGETLLRVAPQTVDAWVMYNTACSWARAGNNERAIGLLDAAVEHGWRDARQFASDPDLSSLWADQRFHHLRARLSGV